MFRENMVVNGMSNKNKNTQKFNCTFCNYTTTKKSDYMKHLTTDKHKNCENDSKKIENGIDLSQMSPNKCKKYICSCGKSYAYDSGYYRHKKNCKIIVNETENIIINKDFMLQILKQNNDFKDMLLEQNKTILELSKDKNNITNNSNYTNIHNKTFNLQVFLNETCKDAMNIMDFVDSIKLQLTDLESVGQLGYVKGMSNIIVKNLKALDVTQRPVHCSDVKREVLYIKDNNKWEKEDPENNKLQKAIKYISHKNILLLSKWREKYPDS